MTQLLIRTFVKGYQDPRDPAVRTAYGQLAGIVGILCNVLLFAGKFTVGMVFGSIAVTADAVNNLSDASSNVVSLLGFKLGAKKPDEKHPYGYARYEYLAGLAVGYWSSTEDVLQNWSVDREFMPGIPDEERTRRLKGWNKAVRCSYGWAKEE